MRPLLLELHLPEGVAVDSHDVEHLRPAAQLRMLQAAEYVPGVEGVLVHLALCVVYKVRTVRRGDDDDERVDMHHPCARVHLAYGFDARDVGPAHREAELVAPFLRFLVRRHPAPLTAHEAVEGNLVDGSEKVRPAPAGLAALDSRYDVFRGGASIGRKPLRELRREGVYVVGVPVVA